MASELFISASDSSTFLLSLIVSYLKLEERGKVKFIKLSDSALRGMKNGSFKLQVPSFVTGNGDLISEPFQISKALLSTNPNWQMYFLGANEQQKAEITNIKAHLRGEGKELRKYLHKYLESRTFFVSNHLTFADMYMFTQLYDNMIQMTDEQKNQYHNLFRWFKHIQNLPEIRAFLEKQNRLLINDPEIRVSFLEKKKKSKKEKEEKKKEMEKVEQ